MHKFRNFVEDEPAVEERLSTSYRGDDLMTPPDVLLQLSIKEAEKAANLDVNNISLRVGNYISSPYFRILIWPLNIG